ncbi:12158_t:CDS:2 [Gigaspora rosea]|nr:12158_t:CDS:2 [Gigaspora rosea]
MKFVALVIWEWNEVMPQGLIAKPLKKSLMKFVALVVWEWDEVGLQGLIAKPF